MAAATAGWVLGIPNGLHAMQSAAFALVAYVGAVTAFAIGYQERPRKLQDLTLYRVLMFAVPAVAVYGLMQYFFVTPGWDKQWLTTVDFVTANGPQAGHPRVFSLLNSPGTCAAVLGLALVCYLITRRVTLASVTAALLVVACLSVTFVRSTWFAVVVAMLAFVLASRGTALKRVGPLVAVVVLAFSVLSGANGTAGAVVDRVSTFGSLSSDTSANARLDTPAALVPIAIYAPLGEGLGQAGESARLGASPLLRNSDNGYLALIYQTGPMGFVLVLGAALVAFSSSVRMAFRRGARRGDLLVFTLLTFEFIDLLSGDALYGLLGVIFWYLLGVAVSSEEDRVDIEDRAPAAARPPAVSSGEPPAPAPAR
jgi:O-antigen ligase